MKTFNLKEAAHLLGRSYTQMKRDVAAGKINATKTDSGEWRIREDDIDLFRDQHMRVKTPDPWLCIEIATGGVIPPGFVATLFDCARVALEKWPSDDSSQKWAKLNHWYFTLYQMQQRLNSGEFTERDGRQVIAHLRETPDAVAEEYESRTEIFLLLRGKHNDLVRAIHESRAS